MKIAYLLGSLNRGGAENLMLDVFQNAKQNNLKAIGIYRKSGVLETGFVQSAVPTFHLPTNGNILKYLLQLRMLLKQHSILIAHAQQPIDALYSWLACLGTGIKIVLTFHGYDLHESLLSRWIIKLVVGITDLNIFVSVCERNYYFEKYHLNSDLQQVVYNGISFDKFNCFCQNGITLNDFNICDGANIRHELNLLSDILLLGTVGNFNQGRDQITICQFLKSLHEKEVNFHFVFVGKKNESTPHLYDDCVLFCEQNNLRNRVSFLGSRNDVPKILGQLDAFIYSSIHDTFGIALVEAMAVGVPVFVNDWEAMVEVTGDGNYATLYRSNDIDDLLRYFLLFKSDKSTFIKKSAAAKSYVRNKYSIDVHIQTLISIYDDQLN